MIRFLDIVRVPKSAIILAAVSNAAESMGLALTTVTSGNDSTHMPGSKHYTDEALDFRTHGLSHDVTETLRLTALARLGVDYQAVFEDKGGPNEHLHVEYDPLATRKH